MDSPTQIQQLSYEVIFQFLLPLSYEDIINWCVTNKEYQSICQDTHFWIIKATRDLGVSPEVFTNTTLSPRERYLQLLAEIGNICVRGSERVIGVDECLLSATKQNDISLVKYYLERGPILLTSAVLMAASTGNIELYDYLYSVLKDKDIMITRTILNISLIPAGKGGHLNMIEHLLSMGATKFYNSYQEAPKELRSYLITHQDEFKLKYPKIELDTGYRTDMHRQFKSVTTRIHGKSPIIRYPRDYY